MKILLLITFAFLMFSCKSEKIIYVEQDSKTLEGTWDIEGVWLKKVNDYENNILTTDTITFAKDTFDFFYNRLNTHSSNLYMSLANSDTLYHFNNTLNYPYSRYVSSTNINEGIKILNFSLDKDSIFYNPNGYKMMFNFEYEFEQDDDSKPIIFNEDETTVVFTIQFDYEYNKRNSNYVFEGKGKRLK